MMRLVAIVALCVSAVGLSGWQSWRNAELREDLAAAEAAFGMCDATLTAYLEGEEIDDAIPDDLDGFTVPDHWLRPVPEPAPAP